MPIEILYRLPTDEDGALLEQQIRDLDLLLSQSEEDAEAVAALTEKRQSLVEQLPEVAWLRLCVRELSRMDYAHYETLWQEGATWFQEETGYDVTDDIEELSELGRLRRAVLLRAGMLASLRRTVNYKAGTTEYHADTCTVRAGTVPGQNDAWEDSYLPLAWITVDGFVNEMPVQLFAHWNEAAHSLNAGLLPLAPDFLAGRRVVTRRKPT